MFLALCYKILVNTKIRLKGIVKDTSKAANLYTLIPQRKLIIDVGAAVVCSNDSGIILCHLSSIEKQCYFESR